MSTTTLRRYPSTDTLPRLDYDFLDAALPPPLSAHTQSAPTTTTRRTHRAQPPHGLLHLDGCCVPGLSPLSQSPVSSPYDAVDGGSDSSASWSTPSLPDWMTGPPASPSTAADEALRSMMRTATAVPLFPPHFLPSSRLHDLDKAAAAVLSSPWGSVASGASPSSTLSSSNRSPMSWASAAVSSPSSVDLSSSLPAPSSASPTPSSHWSSPSSSFSSSTAASPAARTRSFTFSSSAAIDSQPPARRRYQRTPGLSREQRAERRRQSHRELDAVRRHRDAAAINRLGQLTAAYSQQEQPDQQPPRRVKREHDADGDGGSDNGDKKGKRHRTAVLEHSVEQMEELHLLVDRLTAAAARQCADIAALRLQLQSIGVKPLLAVESAALFPGAMPLLSTSMTRRLAGELGVSGVYNALFMSPSVGLLLVDCASGVALDVNERLIVGAQCTREEIVGRQVAPTYDAVITTDDWDCQPPPHSPQPTSSSSIGNDVSTEAADAENSHSGLFHQYGVTKQKVLALYRGQVDQVHVVWRAQLGDGLAYELPLSSFVASREEGEAGRPRTILVALSLSEAKRI